LIFFKDGNNVILVKLPAPIIAIALPVDLEGTLLPKDMVLDDFSDNAPE
jgi:hypothetical protein